jgi:hypothetical protein
MVLIIFPPGGGNFQALHSFTYGLVLFYRIELPELPGVSEWRLPGLIIRRVFLCAYYRRYIYCGKGFFFYKINFVYYTNKNLSRIIFRSRLKTKIKTKIVGLCDVKHVGL